MSPEKYPKKLKSILYVSEVCNSIKKKVVRFCDEFNHVLLITPRNKSREQKAEVIPCSDLDVTFGGETDDDVASESYPSQHAQKIEKRLKRAIRMNNKRESRTPFQLAYYDEIKDEVQRRIMNSKTMSVLTICDYMERISDLESKLWFEVFMPTKPFLSDVNNDALVVLINWLKDSAVQIFQNNNASKKVRNSFKVTSALGKGKKTAKKREPLVMIIYGRCGSGKTQLVRCAAEHVGFETFESSVGELRDKASIEKTIDDAETELSVALTRGDRKKTEYALPLVFLDDADIYFEDDIGYLQCLGDLIRTTQLPAVLTTSSRDFTRKIYEHFDKFQIQIVTLDHTADELVFQLQHFVSALFMLDLSDEEISSIIKASGSDIRSALNILQFFYSPTIMRPLYEQTLPKELFDVPSPVFEAPKTKGDARDLAELEYGLCRSGLIEVGSTRSPLTDGIGHVDENAKRNYSVLSEVLVEMYHDLTSEYDSAPKPASNFEEARWW